MLLSLHPRGQVPPHRSALLRAVPLCGVWMRRGRTWPGGGGEEAEARAHLAAVGATAAAGVFLGGAPLEEPCLAAAGSTGAACAAAGAFAWDETSEESDPSLFPSHSCERLGKSGALSALRRQYSESPRPQAGRLGRGTRSLCRCKARPLRGWSGLVSQGTTGRVGRPD
jgi:hypothetical protein